MVRPHRLAVALVLALAWAGTTRAQAANILELNFWLSGPRYDAALPGCEDPIVLRKIIQYFGEKERAYWQSDLQIVAFERIRETGFRPWARGAPDAIPRRFCSAKAHVSDARIRPIYYWIGEDTGWLGVQWGVEWCVVGLDRNWAYNPACQMARP